MKIFKFIFLFITTVSIAQSGKKLDEKNGFRNFSFGAPAKNYDIKLSKYQYNSNSERVKDYLYVGNEIKDVVGVGVRNVYLYFVDDKLFGIQVMLGTEENEFSEKGYSRIKDALITLYGSELPLKTNDLSSYGSIWKGNRVSLELIRKFPVDDFDGGYIYIFDKVLEREATASDF